MQAFEYTIQDALGIHARPAGLLVREAGKYQSEIVISKGENRADLKKVFRLLGLAVKTGDTVRVSCEGPDEDQAAEALRAYMASIL